MKLRRHRARDHAAKAITSALAHPTASRHPNATPRGALHISINININ
jgi:hypothetical protein